MRELTRTEGIQAAAVSDRGLSEKRPVNEDSFLSDIDRGIFAVADGVGGAQAGEVASQTAMEVLDEAFRHQLDGADIEDLMEIAIQRANASIFELAHEQPKFSAMATTVVALHIEGRVATFGHVGDSRLYRLTPDGRLHRETADHSVVEEEVRAGRMTPEQAAHHPSRNVISRALGADSGVEVDMKTIEIEEGTTFLLCSDGITRHIPDGEIRELLASPAQPEEICGVMKKRCYERGAEDNLTAVIVRVGVRPSNDGFYAADDEQTVIASRSAFDDTLGAGVPSSANVATAAPVAPQPVPAQVPAQAVPIPASIPEPAQAASHQLPPPPVSESNALRSNPVMTFESHSKKKGGGAGRAFLLLLLTLGIGAAAFYGGMYYQRQRGDETATQASASPTPVQTPMVDDTVMKYEERLGRVDKEPAAMLTTLREEAATKGAKNTLESTDPELLYLYGRALMLTGDYPNALTAFERANTNVAENSSPLYDKLKIDSRVAAAAVALKIRASNAEDRAVKSLDDLVKKPVTTPTFPTVKP